MGNILLCGEDKLDVALRVANRAAGNIDIHQRTVLSLPQGFVGCRSLFQRFVQDLSLLLEPILRNNESFERASDGFWGCVSENWLRSFVPMHDLALGRSSDHRVRHFIPHEAFEINFHQSMSML